MLPVEEAIVEKLQTDGPCGFEEVVIALSSLVGDKYSSPLIACRGTDGYLFANSATRRIKSHSVRQPSPQGHRTLDFRGMEEHYDLSKMSEPEC